MIRRLGVILGLLVLLGLAAAWAFGSVGAAYVNHPRGYVLIGAGSNSILGAGVWVGGSGTSAKWEVGRTHLTRVEPTWQVGTTDAGQPFRFLVVRVPIWPLMLAVAALMVWRLRAGRRRRERTGFPVEALPADRGPR